MFLRVVFIAVSWVGPGAVGQSPNPSLDRRDEIGQAVQKRVDHGAYVQYMPNSVRPDSTILVICHGVFSQGTAVEAAANCIDDWFAFAEENRVILVAPAFDNGNFACSQPGALGGYRTLTGRVFGADAFLHEIIDVYKKMNPNYDGRFLLFGHSAGGQFANRYIVRHPERIIAALISSPAWFAFPDANERWPYGMQPRKGNFKWGDTGQRVPIDVTPDPDGWLQASQLPIRVIVGELDVEELKNTGKTHVTQATDWVAAMNQLAESKGVDGTVTLQIVPGVGHNYGKLSRAGATFLSDAVKRR